MVVSLIAIEVHLQQYFLHFQINPTHFAILAKFSLISSPLVVIFVFGEIDFENFSVCQFQNSVIESNTVYKKIFFSKIAKTKVIFEISIFEKLITLLFVLIFRRLRNHPKIPGKCLTCIHENLLLQKSAITRNHPVDEVNKLSACHNGV